jgi:heme exporter protein D
MIWTSAAEFWAMGGYGVYVWGSMGVSAALMALEVWLTRMGRKQALDAVCEAMEAEALDAQTPSAAQVSRVGASRSVHFSQGAAS